MNPINFSAGTGLKPGSKLLYGGGLGDWRIVACTDLNGDGSPDLVFQNGGGQIYVWTLDGTVNPINRHRPQARLEAPLRRRPRRLARPLTAAAGLRR
ncbi:MAG: FG-GAP repeat protein [Verrucomicrobia bacterium]|nr:FG-GAP repeat protein [Verrucomicrobiota bacterium]